MKKVNVVAAVIEKDGKILIARRKEGKHLAGLWEFPGGKREDNETPEQCIARELKEELGVNAVIGDYVASSLHDYGNVIVDMVAYWASVDESNIKSKDHDKIEWIEAKDFSKYELAPADIPIVNVILAKAINN